MDDWITLPEAAEIIGVRPGLLRTWRNRGGPQPTGHKFGRDVMYLRPEVEAWAKVNPKHRPLKKKSA